MRIHGMLWLAFSVLHAQGNVGIGTALPQYNLEVWLPYPSSATMTVSSHMPADGVQADIAFHLCNRDMTNLTGPFVKWSIWMADPDGGYGVQANGWEIWEYPPNGGNNCCRARFRVQAGSTAGQPAYLTTAHELYAYGFFTFSDATHKADISPLREGLTILRNLHPVSFRWRDTGLPQVGFIAQEVQRAAAEAVVQTYDGKAGVDYMALTAVLVRAIQELSGRIEALEQRKAYLERECSSPGNGK